MKTPKLPLLASAICLLGLLAGVGLLMIDPPPTDIQSALNPASAAAETPSTATAIPASAVIPSPAEVNGMFAPPVLASAGDANSTSPPNTAKAANTADDDDDTNALPQWPRPLVDGRGTAVTISAPPARIVSLAPNVTEILLAIGAGEMLVGVPREGDHSHIPPQVARLSVYPQISSEALLELRADLVLGADITSEAQAARLRKLGLPLLILNNSGYDGIVADIRLAGEATGHRRQASALADSLTAVLAQTHAEAATDAAPAPRVLLFLGDSLDYAAGRASYADNLLQLAGAANAAASVPQLWPKLSPEFILASGADAIVVAIPPDNNAHTAHTDTTNSTRATTNTSTNATNTTGNNANATSNISSTNTNTAFDVSTVSADITSSVLADAISTASTAANVSATSPAAASQPPPGRNAALSAKLQNDVFWKNLPAVRNSRIYVVSPDLLNLPGPRIGEALQHLRAIVRDIHTGDH